MTISPPKITLYDGCTYEQALTIISDHKLRQCEAAPNPVVAICFRDDAALLAFKFWFYEATVFQDETALVSPAETRAVEAYISENNLESCITRTDLLAMRFYDTDDQRAFEAVSGFSTAIHIVCTDLE
jgi:predicted P-loop ATPase/GTPase